MTQKIPGWSKKGRIETVRLDREPYEAVVGAEGHSFHILFGSQCNGNFLCIPGWHVGCELSYLGDVFWSRESISGPRETFCYENATAIAYALKELDAVIANFTNAQVTVHRYLRKSKIHWQTSG